MALQFVWAVGMGPALGVLVTLTQTVPELVNEPAAKGGTGSIGLVIIGAMIGALVGLVFGILAAGGGLLAGLLEHSIARALGWRTVIAQSIAVGLVVCGLWILVSAGGPALRGSGALESPVTFGLVSAALAFGIGVLTIHPVARAQLRS